MTTFRPRYRALGSLVMVLALALVLPTGARGDDRRNDGRGDQEVTVRCDKGRTIGDALARHPGALTIKVVGTCDEHVAVDRNGVNLIAGGAGAGIHGPDPTIDTVLVTGDRFVLDGLTVTGGRNAVVVSGGSRAMVRNCAVRGGGNGIVGGIGILFFQGANGTVDHCDSSGNLADGLMLDASIATITDSTFSANARAGILVFNGSTARIGITGAFVSAPNAITDNGSTGIHVTIGSMAVIASNTISGNGTNPGGPFGRFGVVAFHSRINLPGGNVITGNFGAGVLVNASTAVIGDPGFGLPTNNIIRGNSTAAPSQGVNVFLNSTLLVRNATIENNNGTGIGLSARSTMTMFSSTVTGHAANGVQLSQGSAAIFQPAVPLPNLSGNTGFDLKCLDGESSFAGLFAAGATIDCTGF
jgi:hypothetical protein